LTYFRAYKAELTISDGMNSEPYIAQNSGRCEKSRGSDDKQNRKIVGQTFKAIPKEKVWNVFYVSALLSTRQHYYSIKCAASALTFSSLV
jgi:hypothetical protein